MPQRAAPAVMPAAELGDDAGGVIRPIRLPSRLGEPQVAVGAGGDAATVPRRRVMPALNSVTTPARGDPPDPVAASFGEPQVAVGAGRDPEGSAPAVMPARELGDDPGRGDPPDLVAVGSVNHRLPSGPAVMPIGRARRR